MTNTKNGRYEIAIRVRTVMQLFNSLDPSPFRERDLDPKADEFVVGWVRELPYGAPFTVVVELPAEEAAKPEAKQIGEAFANYSATARKPQSEICTNCFGSGGVRW